MHGSDPLAAPSYRGRLILVRAAHDPRLTGSDGTYGWSSWVTSRVEVIEIPGTAAALGQDSVGQRVAAQLQECLRTAQINQLPTPPAQRQATV